MVELAGGCLYMTDGAGVVTYDVSTPTAPVRTSIVDTPGFAGNVYVYDGHLYVIDGYAGMRVYSLADPAQLQLTAELTGPGHCYDIRFVGDRAYLASWDHRCVILDVSDRAAPTVISLRPEGSAYGIEVVGQYAYCVNGYSGML
jgi:hypothetical protein